MFEPVHDIVDPPPEMWKREIHCLNFGDVVKMLHGNAGECPLEVSEVFFSETSDPAIGISEGIASPYIRARYRPGENLSHKGHLLAISVAAARHYRLGHPTREA